MSYLPGSCREGRRGSATIPGLNVLPLSPYPSIQLGLLPLASPWKKFKRKGRKKKSITLQRRGSLARPVGAASREARSTSATGARCPPPPTPLPGPALAIHHPLPRQCRGCPAPRRREPRPPELRFHPGGREGGRIASPGCSAGGQEDLGNQGPASAGRVPGSQAATPHSLGWLRRSGHGDLREFQSSPINIASKLKELGDKLQPPFATRLPLQSRRRHPWARFTPLQMSRRHRRPKGRLRSCQALGNSCTSRITPASDLDSAGDPSRTISKHPVASREPGPVRNRDLSHELRSCSWCLPGHCYQPSEREILWSLGRAGRALWC